MASAHMESPAPLVGGNRVQKDDQAGDQIDEQYTPLPIRLQEAEARLDEQLTCWRWAFSLRHRLRVLELRFLCDPFSVFDEQDRLTEEIAAFRAVAAYVKGCAP